jgi:hypothetical protein
MRSTPSCHQVRDMSKGYAKCMLKLWEADFVSFATRLFEYSQVPGSEDPLSNMSGYFLCRQGTSR